ncbi:MAG: hypothetical protein ACRER3_07950 [Pseudomonas fluorescens]
MSQLDLIYSEVSNGHIEEPDLVKKYKLAADAATQLSKCAVLAPTRAAESPKAIAERIDTLAIAMLWAASYAKAWRTHVDPDAVAQTWKLHRIPALQAEKGMEGLPSLEELFASFETTIRTAYQGKRWR